MTFGDTTHFNNHIIRHFSFYNNNLLYIIIIITTHSRTSIPTLSVTSIIIMGNYHHMGKFTCRRGWTGRQQEKDLQSSKERTKFWFILDHIYESWFVVCTPGILNYLTVSILVCCTPWNTLLWILEIWCGSLPSACCCRMLFSIFIIIKKIFGSWNLKNHHRDDSHLRRDRQRVGWSRLYITSSTLAITCVSLRLTLDVFACDYVFLWTSFISFGYTRILYLLYC